MNNEKPNFEKRTDYVAQYLAPWDVERNKVCDGARVDIRQVRKQLARRRRAIEDVLR